MYIDLYIYFLGISHNLFIPSPTNVHCDSFQLFAIKSSLAMNTSACPLVHLGGRFSVMYTGDRSEVVKACVHFHLY